MDDNEQLTMDDCIALIEALLIGTANGSEDDLRNLPIVVTDADADTIQTSMGKMTTDDADVGRRTLALIMADQAALDEGSLQFEVNVTDQGDISVDDVAGLDKEGAMVVPFATTPQTPGFILLVIPIDMLYSVLLVDGVIDFRPDQSDVLDDWDRIGREQELGVPQDAAQRQGGNESRDDLISVCAKHGYAHAQDEGKFAVYTHPTHGWQVCIGDEAAIVRRATSGTTFQVKSAQRLDEELAHINSGGDLNQLPKATGLISQANYGYMPTVTPDSGTVAIESAPVQEFAADKNFPATPFDYVLDYYEWQFTGRQGAQDCYRFHSVDVPAMANYHHDFLPVMVGIDAMGPYAQFNGVKYRKPHDLSYALLKKYDIGGSGPRQPGDVTAIAVQMAADWKKRAGHESQSVRRALQAVLLACEAFERISRSFRVVNESRAHMLLKRKAQSLRNLRATLRAGHQNRLAALVKHH